jgi:hypothetical protein
MTPVKQVTSPSNEIQKLPNSVQQVALVMKQMDEKYNTTFRSYIQSEANIAYFCSLKASMVQEYFDQDAASAINALKWMVQDWSVNSVAEVIIKIFYQYGISSVKFSQVISGLASGWPSDRVCDLLVIILVGEVESAVAAFIISYSTIETRPDLFEIFSTLSNILCWGDEFCKNVLLEMVSKCRDSVNQRLMLLKLQDENSLQILSNFSSVDFGLILDLLLSK